jgi:nucleotide-binding universal stress UspA family protein
MRTIVAGFDNTDSARDAVRLARHLAEAAGGRVVATFVYHRERFELSDTAGWDAYLREIAEREVQACRAVAPAAELRTVAGASVAEGLHRVAEEEDADLLVVGPTHHGALGRVFPGTTAQRLLHGSPCPVAVPPRGYEPPSEPAGRVLVAYDGSPEAEAALAFARALAGTHAAALRLVTVVEPPPPLPTPLPSGYPAPDLLDAARDEALERLRAVRREQLDRATAAVSGVETEALLLEGEPAPNLLDQAGRGVDAIVMGSRAYGPLGAVLAGSVAARVLAEAPCPVVVTPRSPRDAPR